MYVFKIFKCVYQEHKHCLIEDDKTECEMCQVIMMVYIITRNNKIFKIFFLIQTIPEWLRFVRFISGNFSENES